MMHTFDRESLLAEGYTEAEIRTAERTGMEPRLIREISDTYLSVMADMARERKADRG